ncbi:MAG TPA: ATP-binding cassette domain-containing protein [Gaiellaceae bacterium]|nr:ATP-binding cassette domain-containing protein [Gaiellaceae bacterium]
MALARVDRLGYRHPDATRPALEDVSLELQAGELVCLLGPSGSGKSTLLRALAGLVPHFHGGTFAGRVEVGGRDTRRARPSELAGTVASVFQDPEDQVVFTLVANEVEFGLENLGVPAAQIPLRARAALEAGGVGHLARRRTSELSAGELQRVCLASALALGPELLLLDEPTSQLDPEAAERLLERLGELEAAAVVSEQRPALPLEHCDRVLFLEAGRLLLDAPREPALDWLERNRPAYLGKLQVVTNEDRAVPDQIVVRLEHVAHAYDGRHAVGPASLEVGRGEIVALTGPNGSGKTTLAKLAAGLLEPASGRVDRKGRAAYLSQDPGRYVVAERVDEEVALGVGGDLARARKAIGTVGLGGFEARHPRDLSSGERERVALAAVLVTDPDLLVLDEPTRGMDPDRKRALAALLRRDSARRATLVVTHDLSFAGDVADRAVSLETSRELVVA